MRYIIIIILAIFLFKACDGDSAYDEGYDAGYDGATKSVFYSLSKSYKTGYEDGANDAYYFNLGCNDKNNEEPPQYPLVSEYMEGYYEC